MDKLQLYAYGTENDTSLSYTVDKRIDNLPTTEHAFYHNHDIKIHVPFDCELVEKKNSTVLKYKGSEVFPVLMNNAVALIYSATVENGYSVTDKQAIAYWCRIENE